MHIDASSSLRFLRSQPQHFSRFRPDKVPICIRRHPIHDRVSQPAPRHDHAFPHIRKIVTPLPVVRRSNRLRIEDRTVGGHLRHKAPAVADAEQVRRVGSEPADGFVQREDFAFANPGAEQLGRITGVAQHVHVGTALSEGRTIISTPWHFQNRRTKRPSYQTSYAPASFAPHAE